MEEEIKECYLRWFGHVGEKGARPICHAVRKKVVSWSPPLSRVFKFNVDGAAKGKLDPAGVGGFFRINREGSVV